MEQNIIIETIKKHAKTMIIAGILGFAAAGGFALYNILNGNFSSLAMLCIVISLICIVLAAIGLHDLIDPRKSFELRSNPELIDMAQEHFTGITYKDDYLTLSERMISATDNPTTVSYKNEVYLVYIEKNKTNFVTTAKSLVIETARGSHRMDVLKLDDQIIQENIIRIILTECHNAVFGYSGDNVAYLEQARLSWKQNHIK